MVDGAAVLGRRRNHAVLRKADKRRQRQLLESNRPLGWNMRRFSGEREKNGVQRPLPVYSAEGGGGVERREAPPAYQV